MSTQHASKPMSNTQSHFYRNPAPSTGAATPRTKGALPGCSRPGLLRLRHNREERGLEVNWPREPFQVSLVSVAAS